MRRKDHARHLLAASCCFSFTRIMRLSKPVEYRAYQEPFLYQPNIISQESKKPAPRFYSLLCRLFYDVTCGEVYYNKEDAAFRIWNGYLMAREPAKRAEACGRIFLAKSQRYELCGDKYS